MTQALANEIQNCLAELKGTIPSTTASREQEGLLEAIAQKSWNAGESLKEKVAKMCSAYVSFESGLAFDWMVRSLLREYKTWREEELKDRSTRVSLETLTPREFVKASVQGFKLSKAADGRKLNRVERHDQLLEEQALEERMSDKQLADKLAKSSKVAEAFLMQPSRNVLCFSKSTLLKECKKQLQEVVITEYRGMNRDDAIQALDLQVSADPVKLEKQVRKKIEEDRNKNATQNQETRNSIRVAVKQALFIEDFYKKLEKAVASAFVARSITDVTEPLYAATESDYDAYEGENRKVGYPTQKFGQPFQNKKTAIDEEAFGAPWMKEAAEGHARGTKAAEDKIFEWIEALDVLFYETPQFEELEKRSKTLGRKREAISTNAYENGVRDCCNKSIGAFQIELRSNGVSDDDLAHLFKWAASAQAQKEDRALLALLETYASPRLCSLAKATVVPVNASADHIVEEIFGFDDGSMPVDDE